MHDSSVSKRCTRCGEVKPATTEFFYAHPRGLHGLRSICKPCRAGQNRERDRAHPEKAKAKRERIPRARRTEYARKWRILNRDLVLQRDKELRQRDPFKAYLRGHNYRARKRAAPGTFTAADVRAQFAAQDGKCYWCRTPLKIGNGETFHTDHLIPLAKGGSNGPENIVCACPSCNTRKTDKMPWEFAGRLM